MLEVAHMQMTLSSEEAVICHGKSSWLGQEKVAKLLRQGEGHTVKTVY